MNKIKILFLISATRINKKGLVPLICRITYLGKRKPFSTGLFINPKNWSSAKQQAVPLNTENTQINTQLSLIKQEGCISHARVLSCSAISMPSRMTRALNSDEIGRASVGKECRSRWSPYH